MKNRRYYEVGINSIGSFFIRDNVCTKKYEKGSDNWYVLEASFELADFFTNGVEEIHKGRCYRVYIDSMYYNILDDDFKKIHEQEK